jgi:hypothetical protein
MNENIPFHNDYNIITNEDLDEELKDLEKMYIDYVENEKDYIKSINTIIENRNIKFLYLTKLSFFGLVFSVNLMHYLIYYDYLNLKRLTYN